MAETIETHPYEFICDTSDREKWLERRREGIGGSDAPAIMGLVNWASPTSVQVDKWGVDERQTDMEALEMGLFMEGPILDLLAERTGCPVERYGNLIRSNANPFMQCTPDGLLRGMMMAERPVDIFVQAKNTMFASDWDEDTPEHVYCQVQHEMVVTGEPYCIVAALLGGRRFVWDVVRADPEYQERLIAEESHFWNLTLDLTQVEPDGSEATRKALGRLHPEDNGETIALPPEWVDLDTERERLRIAEKEAKECRAAVDNQIRQRIGDNTAGTLPSGVVYTLKRDKKGTRTLRRSAAK